MALTLGELSGVITLDDKPFEKGLGKAQSKLEGFGSKGKVLALAAGAAIGAAMAVGVANAMNVDKAKDKLNAQLGLTGKDAEKAGKAAGKLYAGAYGDSMEDVTGAVGAVMSSIKGMRTASEEDVTAMTAKVLDLAAAFEIDAGRAAQVAGQMITSGLAKDGVQAADLLAGSLQKVPAAVREDLMDAVDEYAPFMSSLGIKGEEAMGLLVTASEKGMYGIDKTGDALKEFGIRATDMSKATSGAYDALGMNQEEMTGKLLAGGDTAKTALGDIIHGLQEMEDPVAQSQAALALFGTPLEDLSVTEIPNFLGAIDPMGDKFDSLAGKADELGKTLSDNAATKIESFKRTAEMAFVNVLGGQVLPVLEKVAGFISATFGPTLTGLHDLIVKGNYTGILRDAFGWEEDSSAVDVILSIRDAALKIPAAFDKVIQKIVEFKEPIGAVAGLILLVLIPHWVALGIEALKSAGQQVAAWAMARTAAVKAAFVHSGVVTKMVAGWVLMGVVAMVNAAKIAASWLIALGPVGWLILAIAGIGGAVWAAYENIGWFRDGVDAAFKWVSDAVGAAFAWIQEAIGAVVDWFTGTAVPAWDAAVKSVGGFFTWLYETAIKPVFDGVRAVIQGVSTWFTTVIVPAFQMSVGFLVAVFQGIYNFLKPVFDSIGVIINGFYLFFRGIFQLVSSIITYVVIPLFMTFWNRIVEVFSAVGKTISDWWNGAVAVFNTVVTFIRTVLAAVFTWYLNNVIKPVWNAVTGAIKNAWAGISGVFNTIVSFIRTVLSTAFTWLRDSVIKPVFDGIGNAISWVWNNVLKPMFNAWVSLFRDVLGPAFKWLYENAIKPAFDGIGSAIKFVWEKVIKPVFDTIKTFITKTIPKAFEDGVKFVKTAWDKIQDIAKAPIRFVIDTVINDGLINAFNTIAGVLPGIDKLPRVALPAGFADGGYTGPGRKNDPAGIVHAGEVVWSQDDIRRHGGVGAVEGMRRGRGYANGGRVAPLKNLAVTQGYNRVHKGIDYAAAEGTPVFATQGGVVNHAGPGARAPGVWGGNEVHIAGSGLETWFAHLSRIGVGMGQRVRAGQQIGLSGNTGISSGPHLHFGVFNGGWPNDIDPNSYLGGAGVPSGGTGGGFNPIAGIIDGLVGKFKEQFPGGGIFADMAIGIGKKILDGASKWVTDTLGGKDRGNAAGPTVYDGGGWLENTGGPQLVQHNKSKPDAVLSDQQWADIHKLALGSAAGGVNYSPTYQIMGDDAETVMRRDKARFVDLLNSTAPAY